MQPLTARLIRVFIYVIMKKLFIALLASCIALFSTAQNGLNIIPIPVQAEKLPGYFEIDANTTLRFAASDKMLAPAAKMLQNAILQLSGINVAFNKPAARVIELKKSNIEQLGSEGYTLQASGNVLVITANKPAGLFYATQTLLQMLPAIRTNAPLRIPGVAITDYPRFAWRGMHLDVSRHFFGPEVIKNYIDLMAAYKMNTFHWHLVDDQGWRIEIRRYPKLTDVSAWRVDQNHLPWGERPQAKPGQTPTYGGYYTQQQIREIVKYAAERNIIIVPEIEMPGHVASAIAAYPQLSCTQKPQLPMTGGNYSGMSSNYCAGNDSVFTFLQHVLDEVLNLFPSTYIHIGGDEVDKGPWKKCSRCQARMQQEHLANEEELQSYFIRRIEKHIAGKDRKLIGWDEILEGGLAPSATVMSWRGEAGGIAAAKMDHTVVMTPGYPLYFDHYQAGPAGEPLAFGGMNTLKNVYDYEPVPAELPQDKAKYVLGAQANLWTEFVSTASHVQYMILPRMPALAEVLWLPREQKNWNDFASRMQAHYKAYDQKGLTYCPGNFTVDFKPVSKNGQLQVQLATEIPGAEIRYTTDGSEPTMQSAAYTTPLPVTKTMTIKAATAQYGRIRSREAATQQFSFHSAIGKPVTYVHPYSRSYAANGPNALTDGIRGTMAIGKYWHGFSGNNLVATIDLGMQISLQKLSLGCLHKYKDWIFLPQWVKFEVSDDGNTFTELATVANAQPITTRESLYQFIAPAKGRTARYIRVTAKNNLCPPGHPGAGSPGWIFADELVVE